MSIDIYPSTGFSTANAVLGYAEVTANQAGITTETDLTGLSVTVAVPAGRRIRISADGGFVRSVNDGLARLRIKEGATVLQLADKDVNVASSGVQRLNTSVIITPSAGAHTYKLSLERVTGTGDTTLSAGATFPSFILVEDITGGTGGGGPIQLAYAEVTANQGSVTSEVDLTGCSVTVAVPAGRRLKVTGWLLAESTVASDELTMQIKEDGVRVKYVNVTAAVANRGNIISGEVILSPTAGTHTYKLTIMRSIGTGTVTVVGTSDREPYILVEDITGTPMSVENLAWIDWTPVLTQGVNVTFTNTRSTYVKIGRTVIAQVDIAPTSAGTAANNIILSLPVPAANANGAGGSFRYFDAGNTNRAGTVCASSTTAVIFVYDGVGFNMGNTDFAIASGDRFQATIIYEAAS